MAENSKIEWCHHTANIWWGCKEVHEGCDNCYARILSHRWGNDLWGNDKPRKIIKDTIKQLHKCQKIAAWANEIHRVFVGSMMDIFEKPMTAINSNLEPTGLTTDYYRQILFNGITDCWPNLQFLLLTKRPSNIAKYVPETWLINPPTNVIYGISVSTQKNLDDLMPNFLKVPGRKFLSIEPQLDEIDLKNYISSGGGTPLFVDDTEDNFVWGGINWVIVGGESGPKKRPFNADWARKLRDQCNAANIPFFMKQMDKVQDIPDDLMIRQFPKFL